MSSVRVDRFLPAESPMERLHDSPSPSLSAPSRHSTSPMLTSRANLAASITDRLKRTAAARGGAGIADSSGSAVLSEFANRATGREASHGSASPALLPPSQERARQSSLGDDHAIEVLSDDDSAAGSHSSGRDANSPFQGHSRPRRSSWTPRGPYHSSHDSVDLVEEADGPAPTSSRKRRRPADINEPPSPPESQAAKRSRVLPTQASSLGRSAGRPSDNDDDVVDVDDFIASAPQNVASSRARSNDNNTGFRSFGYDDNEPQAVGSGVGAPRSRASGMPLTADFLHTRDRTMTFLRALQGSFGPEDPLMGGGFAGDDLVFGGGGAGRGGRRGGRGEGRGGFRGRTVGTRTFLPPEPFSYMPSTLHPSTYSYSHGRGGRGMHALSFMDRDFGPEDYEMLLQLDDAAKAQEANKHAAVRELKLSSLPIVPMPSVGDTTSRAVKPAPSTSSIASSAVILDADDDVIDLEAEGVTHVPKAPTIGNEDCAICREDMPVGLPVKMIPACLHKFHGDCIDTWIRINPVCPICKADV